MTNADCPFLVRVTVKDLNIRRGAGTNFDRVKYIPVGTYTIVEVKAGKGSKVGWLWAFSSIEDKCGNLQK